MSVESEKEWLLEAIEVFFKRFFVVSPQLEILAASRSTQNAFQGNIIGQKCHDLLHDRSSPCINCPVEEAMAGNEPIFRPKPGADEKIGRISCNYMIQRNIQVVAAIVITSETVWPSFIVRPRNVEGVTDFG